MHDTTMPPVLEVGDLSISFRRYGRGLRQESLQVIRSLSLDVRAGEIVAVVGASGSGKSLLAHAILGILPHNAAVSGRIRYQGEALTTARQRALRGRDIALIPQSVDYLDPLMRVGAQVVGVHSDAQTQREVFARYELPPEVAELYPFQLSGGMARRVLIATAVAVQPRLIVADEPTPGLGAALARETLQHFRQLADGGAAVLLITHDLELALPVADRIAVFYAGTTVEVAPASDFRRGADALRHPYSKAFLEALPQNGFHPLAGSQPYAGSLPSGCLFAERCASRTDACGAAGAMRALRGGEVRCVHAT